MHGSEYAGQPIIKGGWQIGTRESDGIVVPMKAGNGCWREGCHIVMTVVKETRTVHSKGDGVETKLRRIAEKARRDPKCKFTSLFHLVNTDLLRGCFEGLRKDAASGIDGVTKEEYGNDLEANLAVLVEKLHRMSYIPQPVRRVYLPKPGSTRQRPLGIPALECTCLEDTATDKASNQP
ncbi:MAG: hypothetical protein PHI06_07655 [Desulfobulbaceae bacterium]|nr:hypothetical protein [Desulfobulbaceae bacterium]